MMDFSCRCHCPSPYPPMRPCPPAGHPCVTARCHAIGKDHGPCPYVVDIESATLENPFFRRTLWTVTHLQLTLMCIAPGQEIGLEVHDYLDQFLRLEQGHGKVLMGSAPTCLEFCR